MIHLTEDVLHFVWNHALFDIDDLVTTDGETIQFISRGKLNRNSGPDFSEAIIKIGDTIWVGNVEIHVHSSDWYLHHHQKDIAYDNVILHVVYFHDKEVEVKNQFLPVFELKNRIPPSLFRKYKTLLQKEHELPCKNLIKEVKSTTILKQIEASELNRLERKSGEVLQLLKKNNNDWEETTFQLLLFNLIGKINNQPAKWLADKISLKLIRSFGPNTFQLEALLFGVGGWLGSNKNEDEYTKLLKKEFHFQKVKFHLEELNIAIWKTGKMRPAQFPIFRLSQLGSLLINNSNLFSRFIEMDQKEITKLFSNITASEYWKNHCQLSKKMNIRSVKMGKMQKDLLLINTVVPLLYSYGVYLQNDVFKTKAIALLKSISAEKNTYISRWSSLDIRPNSAFESQGLLELYNSLCIQKKCLSCNIGMQIIKS